MKREMERIAFISLLLTVVSSSSARVSRQYYFVNKNLSWTEAQRYCKNNYIDLATINNMKDTEELIKTVNDSRVENVWIGLKKTDKAKWRWSLGDPAFYTGHDSQYRNWEQNQPNGDGVCVYMNGEDGKWHDIDCSDKKLFFICYNGSSNEYIPVYNETANGCVGKNWTEAQSYCRKYHTDLASVRNQAENDHIKNIIKNGSICGSDNSVSFWIGLFNDSWEWSDQSDSSFRNWRPGEPNNKDYPEICTVISVRQQPGQWIDFNGNNAEPFICYEDKLVLIQKNLSWTEALNYCRKHHVDLVSVHSEQIQRRVMNVAKNASTAEVWLGLRHSCALDIWFWVRGEIMCDESWTAVLGSGEEDCILEGRSGAVQSGGDQRWVSLPQNHTLNFICTNSQDE